MNMNNMESDQESVKAKSIFNEIQKLLLIICREWMHEIIMPHLRQISRKDKDKVNTQDY